LAVLAAVLLYIGVGAAGAGAAGVAAPKYFFQLRDVRAKANVDPALKTYAGDALKADLAARPEWASTAELGGAEQKGPEALAAELAKRKLRGFNVTLSLDQVSQEVKPPKQGGRLNQLAVDVRLSVFGTTVAEEKLAFEGEGEAGLESEVPEKRMQAEGASLTKDAIKDAVKQAVDQAVLKLSMSSRGSAAAGNGKRKKK
jgi:hypothetical protein